MPTRFRIPLYWFAVAAALLITAAAYIQSAFFEFVYDDFGQIVYNPKIKSWGLALTYFKSHVWSQSMGLAFYYRPLYMVWLRVNHSLFGLNPLYWHLAAIAVHLVVCLLLYFFVCRLAQDKWVAVVSVLLFGLHPAHVESVAWISGTTDSLLASLLLGSLLCYWKHRDATQRNPGRWLAASLLLAFFGALVKETAIIIPALIFSYEWIFCRRDVSRRVRLWASFRAAIPYAVVSFSFLLMRALALKSLTPPSTKVGRLSVLLAWPEAVAFYIGHALFPLHMSVFYKLVTVSRPGLQNFVLPVMLVLAAAAVLFYAGRRSRVWAFLGVWCAIMLIPILNVTLWNNAENLHDRYLYLPSVAVCIMLASLLAKLKELHYDKSALAALIVIAAGYAFVTVRELGYWMNDYVLAQHGIEVSPGHPIAPQLMGNVLIRQERIAEAIPYLVDALNAMPTNVDTLCSLGFCYSEINALPLAEECIGKAVAFRESEPRAHLVLAMVRLKQNRLEEAEAECRRGIELQRVPQSVTLFHYYLGNVLYAKGDVQGALREYRAELQNDAGLDPAFVKAQERVDEIERHSPQARQ